MLRCPRGLLLFMIVSAEPFFGDELEVYSWLVAIFFCGMHFAVSVLIVFTNLTLALTVSPLKFTTRLSMPTLFRMLHGSYFFTYVILCSPE